MSEHDGASRFAPQNKMAHERLSTNTVGLVALSDFRKRRAAVLEQQEREARETALASTSTPDRSLTCTPDHAGSDSASGSGARLAPKKNKKHHPGNSLLSFDDDDSGGDSNGPGSEPGSDAKLRANAAVGLVPKAVTKAALRKEAAEREALRREFVAMQEAIKAAEVAIPFVFYDGVNTPGGTVRMKKGDFVWVFLDKSRKVGADLAVGDQARSKRAHWARVGVDDLMLVRDTIIIPHHYDFYFFVMNKTLGPGGRRLFDYSAEASVSPDPPSPDHGASTSNADGLVATASKVAGAPPLADIMTLEGASDDQTATKVVDRRWYERNKHIYPASTWQEFDPEKDYANEIRKDTGGNTFFFCQ